MLVLATLFHRYKNDWMSALCMTHNTKWNKHEQQMLKIKSKGMTACWGVGEWHRTRQHWHIRLEHYREWVHDIDEVPAALCRNADGWSTFDTLREGWWSAWRGERCWWSVATESRVESRILAVTPGTTSADTYTHTRKSVNHSVLLCTCCSLDCSAYKASENSLKQPLRWQPPASSHTCGRR